MAETKDNALLNIANNGAALNQAVSELVTNVAKLSSITLPVSNGGTGQNSLTANNILLGNGTDGVQFVAPSSNGNILSSNGTTWVSTTFSSFFTGTNQSLASSGYQKFSGGLIVQWGTSPSYSGTSTGNVTNAITFPLAFPNNAFAVTISVRLIDAANLNYHALGMVQSLTTSGFTFIYNKAQTSGTFSGYWIAVGN